MKKSETNRREETNNKNCDIWKLMIDEVHLKCNLDAIYAINIINRYALLFSQVLLNRLLVRHTFAQTTFRIQDSLFYHIVAREEFHATEINSTTA